MASADDIAALRRAINEPNNADPYSDGFLGALIDLKGSVDSAASDVWTTKAATYSSLVDVQESGSSRKLSDLQKNALAMAETFNERSTAVRSGVSFTVGIERP